MEASQMEASQMEAPQAAAEKLAAQASNKGDDDAESNDDPVTASNRCPGAPIAKPDREDRGHDWKSGPAGGRCSGKVPPPPRVRKKPNDAAAEKASQRGQTRKGVQDKARARGAQRQLNVHHV